MVRKPLYVPQVQRRRVMRRLAFFAFLPFAAAAGCGLEADETPSTEAPLVSSEGDFDVGQVIQEMSLHFRERDGAVVRAQPGSLIESRTGDGAMASRRLEQRV